MIKRNLVQTIEKYLFKGKILIIYGARQVGKTTLVKGMLKKYSSEEGYYNCDLLSVKRQLESLEPYVTKSFLGEHKIIVLDEAQKIENIGLVLKQLVDTFPELQIVATGSSSFDLANKLNEPLTGRAFEFKLFPFSLREIAKSRSVVDEKMEKILTYGLYPEVYLSSNNKAQKLIETISSQYLYKDILDLESVRKPGAIINLLELLALQLGSEVSINELATQLRMNHDTVEKYIDLLEKAFVLFRLRSFSRNVRKEIAKKNKIYFYDVGIRNAILNRYNKIRLRDDIGPLWENFLIVERMKYMNESEKPYNSYFWRTYDQKEIDYIEDHSGIVYAYEIKWSGKRFNKPYEFLTNYPNSRFKLISRSNYYKFVGL